MKIRNLDIDGPRLIEPKRRYDMHGFCCETYNSDTLSRHGLEVTFAQEQLWLSTAKGTIRGLHFQDAPSTQHILLRVIRGAVLAVAVDIRFGSPTFRRHVSVELSAENNLQLYVPPGFAHGIATLRPLTELSRKASVPVAAEHQRGIYWDDPALRIPWPVTASEAIVSAEDDARPLLREMPPLFTETSSESGVAA